VRFVDANIIEAELECQLLNKADLVACDAGLGVLWDESDRGRFCPLFHCAGSDDDVEVRSPLLEIVSRNLECWFTDDDQERSGDVEAVFEVSEESDCLESLTEALKRSVSGCQEDQTKLRMISLARMPFRPLWCRDTIQSRPCSW
jgi:hypothetical protein